MSVVRPPLNNTIVLFFSYGICLVDWQRLGVLARQRLLLRALAETFDRVLLVTYGGSSDLTIDLPARCRALVKPSWCPRPLYAVLAPWIHRQALRRARVFYTVQMSGALPGLMAKILYHRPLAVHCGYPWSHFARRQRRVGLTLVAWLVERAVSRMADGLIATADYGLRARQVTILPNGIDVECFRPAGVRRQGLVCWVGRVTAQKNLALLIRALADLPGVTLRVIGDGEEQPQLERLASALRVPTEWIGSVSNDRVAEYLQEAALFAFPSVYEGDPKALLEAMACGLPVVASDIPAHRRIIKDGVNGLLSPPTIPGLQARTTRVLTDPKFAANLGRNARQWVETHRNLQDAVQRECQVLELMAHRHQRQWMPHVAMDVVS